MPYVSAEMGYLHCDTVILVFCKAPIPGQVKTRLMPTYSAAEAANIHTQLTLNTLTRVHQAKLCPVQLWCSPSTVFPFFQSCVDTFKVTLHAQRGSDLGARMHHAFCQALLNYQHVILIGCDCPSLNKSLLDTAINKLKKNHDVVLAPAEDGGYVLIGLRQPQQQLFTDIAWGSASVFASTSSRINQLGLHCFLLPEQWDVDTPNDLLKLNPYSPKIINNRN